MNSKLFNIDTLKEEDVLNAFYQSALYNQYPVAIWKLPQSKIKNMVVDISSKTTFTKFNIEKQPPGFAFSPFKNTDGKSTIYINSDIFFSTENLCFRTNTKKASERDCFLKLYEDILTGKKCPCTTLNNQSHSQHKVGDKSLNYWRVVHPEPMSISNRYKFYQRKDLYCKIVKKAINEIKNSNIKKLVLSRIKIVDLPQIFNPISMFEKLCNAYSNSFIYLVSIPPCIYNNDGKVHQLAAPLNHPEGWTLPSPFPSIPFIPSIPSIPSIGGACTWIGATPEILLSIDKDQIFRTVALAGTQSFKPDTSPKKAVWTQKEIEEQALVCRFIINCFKKIRLREFEEVGPKTIVAGNLMHLKTDFTVDMNTVNFPKLGTIMLDLLHPTSAVCGMPKNESMEFILANENYDREFYSGYLGPVNIDEETHLFVNLRCMKLLNNKAILYAGSGITEDSEPDSEWKETEMKFDTILDVIGK